jgi:hypothetical protein
MADPWDGMSVTFRVNQARVVATLANDGGALVEGPLDLEFTDGRCYSLESQGEDRPFIVTLDY